MDNMKELKEIANNMRIDIVKMYYRAGWGHMAPALSCVDIVAAICFGGEAKFGQGLLKSDRLIMSKGHGCAALYAAFAHIGYIPRFELDSFYQSGTRLIGLASPTIPGISAPTGSLGHGICFATGCALSDKLDGNATATYVILGDGETQEGSVWEAAEFASCKELSNLIVFLDRNGLQASDYVDSIIPIDPVEQRWSSFGWNVVQCDGHDHNSILRAMRKSRQQSSQPTLILAKTTKGKGVTIAENNPMWHSRAPKGDEWIQVCNDLGIQFADLEKI